MRDSNFEQKLQEWANETADFYHEMAMSYDLAFYTQSDLNKVSEQPELLILGINPGSGGKYTADQIEKDVWKNWGANGRMNGTTLLKGNPSIHDKDDWRTWQGLKRTFVHGGITGILDDESKYAWSNIIFFNEPKEKNICGELYQICPDKTLELIKILKPKRILCLSIRKCFDVLNKDIKDHEALIDSFLERGKLFDIPVYGIRHTSYGNAGEKVVGKCLKCLFDREPQETVTKEELRKVFSDDIQKLKERKINPTREKIEEIVKLCVKILERKWAFHEKKNNRFAIADGHLSLTVTPKGDGYIGIRYMNSERKADDKMPEIEGLLKKYSFDPPSIDKGRIIWLGIKKIKYFGGNTPEDMTNSIASELDEVVSELTGIYQ